MTKLKYSLLGLALAVLVVVGIGDAQVETQQCPTCNNGKMFVMRGDQLVTGSSTIQTNLTVTGTTSFTGAVTSTGSTQGANSTALTSTVATSLVQVDVASESFVGGIIRYVINANDGTEFQARSGQVPFAAVNKGGTETCTIDTADADEVVAVSSGTLTNSMTCTTAPTNGILLKATADSSLTETTLNAKWSVIITSGTATVTAQ